MLHIQQAVDVQSGVKKADCAMILSLVNLLGCNPLFGLIALISAVAVGYRFLSFVSSLLDYSVVLSGERLLYQRTGTIRSEPR